MRATNIPQVLLRKKSRFVLCVRRFRSLFVYLQRTAVWRCIVLSVLHAFCGASDRERVPMCGVSGYVCGVVLNAEAAAASPRTRNRGDRPKTGQAKVLRAVRAPRTCYDTLLVRRRRLDWQQRRRHAKPRAAAAESPISRARRLRRCKPHSVAYTAVDADACCVLCRRAPRRCLIAATTRRAFVESIGRSRGWRARP